MVIASRPLKLSHAQTLLYEIDMFRETARQLEANKWQGEFHKWVVLESFLLHFRNLIEFFGKPMQAGTADLSIEKPESIWPGVPPAPATLARLRRSDLWDKYEGKKNPHSISKYLQHCTEQGIEPKDWAVSDMRNELKGTVDEFERLLPDRRRPWRQPNAHRGVELRSATSSRALNSTPN